MTGREESGRDVFVRGKSPVENGHHGNKRALSFVGKNRAAITATHLAGEAIARQVVLMAEKLEMLLPTQEPDVLLAKNHGPLERGAVHSLADPTVAVLAVERVAEHSKFDPLALAARLCHKLHL